MSDSEEPTPNAAQSSSGRLAPTPSPSLIGRGDVAADLLADAEIVALLDFVPVPRAVAVVNGWTPEKQREFIARMAVHGSANKACGEMGKHRNGVNKLFDHPQGASFRAAWKSAVALAKRRMAEGSPAAEFVSPGEMPPTVDHRFRLPWAHSPSPRPSHSPSPRPSPSRGEGEEGCPHCGDEFAAERRRTREHQERLARVRGKLFMARRVYLLSIADEPAARAAWELLCGPTDWAAARAMQPQPDEGDPGCSDLRPLRGAGLQIPLKTGFVPDLTDPGYRPGADPLAQLEQSIARQDPRWNGGRGDR
jgi:hypothetical protein